MIAVAQDSSALHHGIAEGYAAEATLSFTMWALHERPRAANRLEASLAPATVLLTGLLLSALLAIKLVGRHKAGV